jgi:hypothetical protein
MNAPVRHHYTPQFYLRAWCRPGPAGEGDQLYVVQNFAREIRYTRRAPKAIGYQDHLYSFSDTVPAPDRAALEVQVFSPLDAKAADVAQKLVNNETLNRDERAVWAVFIAAMRARTPENIEFLRTTGPDHLRVELGKGQEEYENLREEHDPATVVEWVEERYPGLIENFSLARLPHILTGDVITKVDRMAWHPLNFEDCRFPLLCSDRPCVFTAGIDDPNCVIALPLSPRHAFIAFYRNSQAQKALTQHGPSTIAAALNHNVVTQARDRAYSQNRGDARDRFFKKRLVDLGPYGRPR